MGNAQSQHHPKSAAGAPNPNHHHHQASHQRKSEYRAGVSNTSGKSRRSKLELPDLASLALSSTSQQHQQHHSSQQEDHSISGVQPSPFPSTTGLPQSAPIPIPIPGAGAQPATTTNPGHLRDSKRGSIIKEGRYHEVDPEHEPLERGRTRGRETDRNRNSRDHDQERDSRQSRWIAQQSQAIREREPVSRLQPITAIDPSQTSETDTTTKVSRRSSVTFHPPLALDSLDYLNRYESRDGELRRRPTGAERPRSKTPFKREQIKSNAPIGMRRIEKQKQIDQQGGERIKIPTKFTWKSPAREVFVTGSFVAVPWRLNVKLTPINTNLTSLPEGTEARAEALPKSPPHRDSTSTSGSTITLHEVTVPLSPGSHQIKFIVDDVYMCSEELPTATDNDGNLVNVLEVVQQRYAEDNETITPTVVSSASSFKDTAEVIGRHDGTLSPGVNTSLPQRLTTHLNPPDQFWSSDEEYTGSSSTSNASCRQKSPRRKPRVKPKKTSVWTTRSPPELEYAAQLEEDFLSDPNAPGAHSRILKIIPPAPQLPRFLDKVILNTKEGHEKSRTTYHAGATGGSPTGSNRGSPVGNLKNGRGRRHPPSPTPIPAYIATNTPMALAVAPRLGQGAINTNKEDAGAGDDKSVLPTPSHVVLNHLATSAIKGGVLASAATVRYRKKFITIIYYTTPSSPLQSFTSDQKRGQVGQQA